MSEINYNDLICDLETMVEYAQAALDAACLAENGEEEDSVVQKKVNTMNNLMFDIMGEAGM